jgi:hypothetical protein
MSRNVVFLEDAFGPGWENDLGDEARIETREDTVRGLTPSRYLQLWQLFPDEPHTDVLFCLSQGFDIAHTGEMVGLSTRQVKNAITTFLSMARAAFEQPSFLPPPKPTATNMHIERRPRSRRGRPPKTREPLPAPTHEQVALPF